MGTRSRLQASDSGPPASLPLLSLDNHLLTEAALRVSLGSALDFQPSLSPTPSSPFPSVSARQGQSPAPPAQVSTWTGAHSEGPMLVFFDSQVPLA